MVQRNSLQKQAASQPIQPPQLTKRNAVVPLYISLKPFKQTKRSSKLLISIRAPPKFKRLYS